MNSDLSTSKNIVQAARPTLHGKYYAGACVKRNERTTLGAFAPRRVSHLLFLIRADVRRLNWTYDTPECKCDH